MTPAENAQLALLLEVSGTPKPGNVDRERDLPDLRFEHFLAGAVGAGPGLRAAEEGAAVGEAFERAVAGMSQQEGGNTQFGALLLLVPLVRAAADGDEERSGDEDGNTDLSRERVARVVENTTVEDAANFYRAFDHADVSVRDPPDGMDDLDVRRGGAAADALRERGTTLYDVMDLSADDDGVAAEWTSGFERTFAAAGWLLDAEGPVYRRTSRTFLRLLAEAEDTFVATRNGPDAAAEATRRAQAVLDGEEDAEALAADFVDRDINPGTTADVTAAALFVALERGLEV